MPMKRSSAVSLRLLCRTMEAAFWTRSRRRSRCFRRSWIAWPVVLPVLFDSGIRRGTDILKGLGYGASAVLIGRPYLYGLSVAGPEGVRDVVNILRSELEAAMALTGRTRLEEIDRSIFWKSRDYSS